MEGSDEALLALLTPAETEALEHLKRDHAALLEGHDFSDRFLMRFVWGRKLDGKRAAELLTSHLAWRKKFNIDAFQAERMADYVDAKILVAVPGTYDCEGRAVMYAFAGNFTQAMAHLSTDGFIAYLYWLFDVLSDADVQVQREGLVFFEDFRNASFTTLLKMARGSKGFDMQAAMNNVQECIPGRVRVIYAVDAPWYVSLLVAAMRPFMKSFYKVYAISRKDIHKVVPRNMLLKEFGGDIVYNQEMYKQQLMSHCATLSEGKYLSPTTITESMHFSPQENPAKKVNI